MNELKLIGIEELNSFELSETNGGSFWYRIVEIGIGFLIDEWDSTKQAAIDAWNGDYNPPE
jgi:hypothetical protein